MPISIWPKILLWKYWIKNDNENKQKLEKWRLHKHYEPISISESKKLESSPDGTSSPTQLKQSIVKEPNPK